jgi:hypothetical protein
MLTDRGAGTRPGRGQGQQRKLQEKHTASPVTFYAFAYDDATISELERAIVEAAAVEQKMEIIDVSANTFPATPRRSGSAARLHPSRCG